MIRRHLLRVAIRCLTRLPSPSLDAGERTHVPRRPIDAGRAAEEHRAYRRALRELGLEVEVLPAAPELPDAVFVEDVAVALPEVIVLGRSGAESRRDEAPLLEPWLPDDRPLRRIREPGTLEGGDVLPVGRVLHCGLSGRTNRDGVEQLRAAAAPFGWEVREVPTEDALHLRTACAALTPDLLLLNPDWLPPDAFPGMERLPVPEDEPFGAGVLVIPSDARSRAGEGVPGGGTAVVAFRETPGTVALLRERGFRVVDVSLSEFRKAEGGPTCLSLRIPEPR